MTTQPEEHTIATLILSNISINEGNQTMKFGQLIEYKMRKIIQKMC